MVHIRKPLVYMAVARLIRHVIARTPIIAAVKDSLVPVEFTISKRIARIVLTAYMASYYPSCIFEAYNDETLPVHNAGSNLVRTLEQVAKEFVANGRDFSYVSWLTRVTLMVNARDYLDVFDAWSGPDNRRIANRFINAILALAHAKKMILDTSPQMVRIDKEIKQMYSRLAVLDWCAVIWLQELIAAGGGLPLFA